MWNFLQLQVQVLVLVFAYIPEYAPPEQTYKYEVDALVEIQTGAHMLHWAENHNILDRVGSVFL